MRDSSTPPSSSPASSICQWSRTSNSTIELRLIVGEISLFLHQALTIFSSSDPEDLEESKMTRNINLFLKRIGIKYFSRRQLQDLTMRQIGNFVLAPRKHTYCYLLGMLDICGTTWTSLKCQTVTRNGCFPSFGKLFSGGQWSGKFNLIPEQ